MNPTRSRYYFKDLCSKCQIFIFLPNCCRFRGSTESVDGGASFQWSRLPGQPCAVTDKLIGSLAGGNNGSSALAFSPSGR